MQNRSQESEAEESSTAAEDFEALAYPLLDTLYNTAVKLTRKPLDAEDLVQNTYLKAFRHFHGFTPGTNFKAWIFRILIANFSHESRRKQGAPAQTRSDVLRTTVRGATEAPDLAATAGQGSVEEYQKLPEDQIHAALERLPDPYRTVVLLSDVNDFRYKEIADLLQCPIDTVMSRLSRARRLMARLLRELAPSPKTD
ncbi:MAG: sigma-70 family RNA polymerase sigma factor [bacterium]